MAINGGVFTQDFRTQLRKYSDGATRVGEEGRLWYNNADQTIRVSDGSTAGGVVINAGGGSSGVTVQEEGSALSTAGTTLNFVGSSVTASGTGAIKTITIVDSSLTVQDEGGSLSTTATTLNFVGSGVVASGTGATKTITISGGGGGGSDIVDDTSPQLGGNLDINGFNITSGRSNENINIIPNGTGKLVVAGDFLPSQNVTYDLGSSSFRWKDLYLSGDTLNLAGSTITSDGTGTIEISADGVTLPLHSKTDDDRELAVISKSSAGATAQVVVPIPFFKKGNLITSNAVFEFNATIDEKFVFTDTSTFTLSAGGSLSDSSITLFQF